MNKYLLILCAVIWLNGIYCKSEKNLPLEFKNILVLGNSITLVTPNNIWQGNWGMAASQKSKDYVHILASRLNAEVTPVNISEWELNHRTFQLSNLDKHFIQVPDLIILRIGENVNNSERLEQSLTELLSYIRKKDANVMVIITGTFWQLPSVNSILSTFALKNGFPFVPLSKLDTKENRSFIGATLSANDGSSYQLNNQGVADHPGDLGMEAIAEAIIQTITKIRTSR